MRFGETKSALWLFVLSRNFRMKMRDNQKLELGPANLAGPKLQAPIMTRRA
jgi:hypothetical protein